MSELVDQFCPNSHDAAISALCWDPETGSRASADTTGRVAITRRGESAPGLVFIPGGPIHGAIAMLRGGSLIAIGDNHGNVGVYKTNREEAVFRELREPPQVRIQIPLARITDLASTTKSPSSKGPHAEAPNEPSDSTKNRRRA